MWTKVYSFRPKGKGYRLYTTKTYHGNPKRSSQSSRSSRSSGVGNVLAGMVARGIVRGLFGKKR